MKIVLADLKLKDPIIHPLRIGNHNNCGCLCSLGLEFLRAVIKEDTLTRGADIEILHKAPLIHQLDMIKREIVKRTPDVVGFSVYVWNYYRTLKLCELVKKELPETTIILGGPQVSFCAESILKKAPHIDGIIRGEGEMTFLEFVRSTIQKKPFGKDILGMSYRKGEKIISNPDRPLLDDLNRIPSPYLTKSVDMSTLTLLEMETSRGCPYRCAYCVWPDNNKIRLFNEKRVIKELKLAADYGITNVIFWDAIFNLPKIVYNMCKKIIEQKINITFFALFRPELINKKILDIMEKAGMTSVEVGVQSFNPETLALINRGANAKKIEKAFELLHKRDISVGCDLIIGLPGDTLDTIKENIDTAYAYSGTFVNTFLLHVLPGSLLWSRAEQYGLTFMKNPPHFILSTAECTKGEIMEAVKYSNAKAFEFKKNEILKSLLYGKSPHIDKLAMFDPIFGG